MGNVKQVLLLTNSKRFIVCCTED